jgi:hypothetical protein
VSTLAAAEPITWHVVFTPARLQHWIFKVLHRDYGHVYAIKSLNDYQWLVVQPRLNMTDIRVKLKTTYPHVRMLTGPDARIITVDVVNGHDGVRGGPCWYNCVEQVKALLGIRSFWTLTPKQLYDGLIGHKYGARKQQNTT